MQGYRLIDLTDDTVVNCLECFRFRHFRKHTISRTKATTNAGITTKHAANQSLCLDTRSEISLIVASRSARRLSMVFGALGLECFG
jgi:hypothetical protein